MALKHYTVNLDEDVVDEAYKIFKKYGSKMSPLLNQLLKDWLNQEKIKEGKNAIEYSRV